MQFPKPAAVITGHKAVREALRNTQTYSSDLQGDADVRDYRQLPLEVDPPRHHLYRAALAPYFVRPTIERHIPEFRAHTLWLLESYFSGEPRDVVSGLALPLVMRNLGSLYRRPQDVEEWISWGPDVWTAHSQHRDGAVLHAYLDRIYDEALQGHGDDIWYELAHMEIDGVQISALEFRGIASVLLAGGRDTVVKLFTGMMWHFARHPEDLEFLRRHSSRTSVAIQELLRFLSPLPAMARTTVPESGGMPLPDDRYVQMSFISGNFDEDVFPDPLRVDFSRPRIPHLSFGFGPHTCLGNHVAEVEAAVLLEAVAGCGFTWEVTHQDIRFHKPPLESVPDHFRAVHLRRI